MKRFCGKCSPAQHILCSHVGDSDGGLDGDFVGSSDRGDSDGNLDGDFVGSVVNGEFDGVMLGR